MLSYDVGRLAAASMMFTASSQLVLSYELREATRLEPRLSTQVSIRLYTLQYTGVLT